MVEGEQQGPVLVGTFFMSLLSSSGALPFCNPLFPLLWFSEIMQSKKFYYSKATFFF